MSQFRLNRLDDSGADIVGPDVQQTTLGLDVFGRHVCNQLSEALAGTEFDAIVIGSGMYGGYCAAEIFRLSRQPGHRPLRVLVLEAGPFLLPEHKQNLPNIGVNDTFDLVPPETVNSPINLVWGASWRSNIDYRMQAYCVGGKSLFWGGWCPRLQAEDFKFWPQAVVDYLNSPPTDPAPGVSFPTVYDMMERELGVQPTDDFIFDPFFGAAKKTNELGLNEVFMKHMETAAAKVGRGLKRPLPPPIAVKSQSDISGTFSLDKYSSLPTLIGAVRDNDRGDPQKTGIYVVPFCHVSRLVCPVVNKDGANTANYRITEIEVFYRGQPVKIPVKASCAVVLAASTIESTRLALESLQAPNDVGGAQRIGENLMVHLRFDFPQGNGAHIARTELDKVAHVIAPGSKLAETVQQASLHLQAIGSAGQYHYQVYAAATNENDEDGGATPEELMYRLIPDLREGIGELLDQDKNKIAVVMRACGEAKGVLQDSTATSHIRLSNEIDQPFGHRRAHVELNGGATQDALWTEMNATLRALAVELKMDNVPTADMQRDGLGSTWHESGTLWMGDNPQESVTDANGRFHHISNAYCADQSLFPTVGSANPVLTGVCLANKVAEHIVHRHVSEPNLDNTAQAAEVAAGFQFLLDDANHAKWKSNDGRAVTKYFTGVDRILEMSGGGGLAVAFYDDPAPLGNFELRLQWKCFGEGSQQEISANSGIFLRAPRPGATLDDGNFYDQAIEIQIDETGYDFARRAYRSPLHKTGAIYKIAPAQQWNAKVPSVDNDPGVWNSYQITAQGSNVKVVLNGQLVSETNTLPSAIAAQGCLAFQYHTGRTHFRYVRVKRLP